MTPLIGMPVFYCLFMLNCFDNEKVLTLKIQHKDSQIEELQCPSSCDCYRAPGGLLFIA